MSTTRGTRIRMRRARPDDVDRIHEIETLCYATPWTAETFRAFVTRRGVLIHVAEVEQDGEVRIMGYAVLWRVADEAELANLAVAPSFRGRGIAGALLDRLLRRATRFGVAAVFLEVRQSNEAALALYRTRGFEQVGVRRQYYDRPQEDARILRLDLRSPRGFPA